MSKLQSWASCPAELACKLHAISELRAQVRAARCRPYTAARMATATNNSGMHRSGTPFVSGTVIFTHTSWNTIIAQKKRAGLESEEKPRERGDE